MNDKKDIPRLLTVRQTAKTEILPEHTIRILLKTGWIPAIYVGKKALINFDKLVEKLENL